MQKRICVCKRLKVGIRASSTLAWYKDGGRKNDEVMYNFKHGAELVFKSAGLPSNVTSTLTLPTFKTYVHALNLFP